LEGSKVQLPGVAVEGMAAEYQVKSSQFTVSLPCHPAHDIETVDQEERSRFVRDRMRHKRLTSTGWTEQEDTMRGLDTDRLEELWMTQWQSRICAACLRHPTMSSYSTSAKLCPFIFPFD
jgi:hypothetical protein